MLLKKLIQNFKKYLPIFFVGIFSFFINYHYAFIGVMPLDNFVLYNGGYKVLNGFVPFTDYWLVTGPLLDYLNALFFRINGVSWSSYIIHSSLFNLLISISTYFLFTSFELSKFYSIIYSVFFAILFYPVVGTPFVDHHSTFFLVLGFYSFILATKKEKYFYYKMIPIFFCLSFLSKQTPAAYGLFSMILLLSTYLLYNKKQFKKIFTSLLLGSVISLLLLVTFFYFANINYLNFYDQYIVFAGTIGSFRFSNYELNLIDIIIDYKFINFFIILLIFLFINLIKKNKKNMKDIFPIFASVVLALILIFHQIYTMNENYIFFLIPLLAGFVHIFHKKISEKKIILIISIIVCVFATTKYHIRFNEHKKFIGLEKVDLKKAVDAKNLSIDLSGLKWITPNYPNNPAQEVEKLSKVIDILSNDKSKKALITDYQFIPASLGIHDFSPNQWHHPGVSFPLAGDEYFEKYKYFFIERLKENSIKYIYETTEKENSIIELVLNKECVKKSRISDMLLKFEIINSCEDFK